MHQQQRSEQFRPGIVSNINNDVNEGTQESIVFNDSSGSEDELGSEEGKDNLDELKHQLEHNLASLFLKMQTVMHISVFMFQFFRCYRNC